MILPRRAHAEWLAVLLVLLVPTWWLKCLYVACLCLVCKREVPAPMLVYGSEVASLIESVPLLQRPMRLPIGMWSGFVQLAVFSIQFKLDSWRCPYAFEREEVDVDLQGRFHDKVALQWLQRSDTLPDDAPIVLLCPGLCNHERDLPGTNLYHLLLQRKWRTVVYLKRGLAGPLRAPVLHVFGHPSDLKAAIERIATRYRNAPIHVVCFSSGNGLGGSTSVFHGAQLPSVSSYLLLCGGCDYSRIAPDHPMRPWTELLFSRILKPAVQQKLVAPHKATLCKEDAQGYRAVMAAETFQKMHDSMVAHFGGFGGTEDEANGFLGGNARLCRTQRTPFLSVYTEDDPVSPGGPRADWLDHYADSTHAACAVFSKGSHLACYEGLDWSVRWIDRLVLQWIDLF